MEATQDIKPLTLQEAFDKVWTHFVVEGGKQSVDTAGSPMYRSDNDAKCAVGIFITDEEYRRELEYKAANFLPNHILNKFDFGANVLAELQACHDGSGMATFESDIRRELRIFATKHNLTIP